MTSTPTHCLECNAPLSPAETQGLCARCLLKMGLASQFGESSVADAGARKFVPPPMFPFDFGGYRVRRLLGRGGMGAVYEAEQRETGRRVALKVLGHTIDTPDLRARFLREGRLAAAVNHPNSVYIFGTEEIEGAPVIAMELVAGGTLRDRIRQGPLPVREAVDAILQVIAGLEAAASAGVLHRDVKPANCFVTPDGIAKVGDFGLSVSTLVRHDSQLTASGVMLGTPSYAAPEQLRGDELDVRADIYSVGATLYSLLTGHAPHEGDNVVQVVAAVLDQAPRPLAEFRKDVPAGLAQTVARCLAKKRDARFAHYAALRTALLPFSSQVPEPAPLMRRQLAGCIDSLIWGLPTWVLMLSTGEDISIKWLSERTWTSTWMMLGYFAFFIAYHAWTEGRWGASIGKALCGLRLADAGRATPRLSRATVRALVFALLMFAPFFFPFLLTTGPGFRDLLQNDPFTFLGWWGLLCLVMCVPWITMRRRNGFAALHDLASGTRVVVRPRADAERPRLEIPAPPALPAEGERIGPYLLGEALATGVFRAGYDEVLRRRVWIRLPPADAASPAEARREISRATRLRWIGGERSAGKNWDAYEAPAGQPLRALAPGSQPWAAVRHWLHDLAAEIDAATKDGTLPEQVGLDHVWLTVAGRAVLLDEPWCGNKERRFSIAEPAGAQHFLSAVADATLDRSALPLHARDFLIKLRAAAFDRVSFLLGNLQSLLTKPATVSRERRFAALALLPGCAVLVVLLIGATLSAAIERMTANNPRSTDEWIELRKALDKYSAVRGERVSGSGWWPPPATVTGPAMVERVQVHVRGHFGTLLQSPAFDRDAEKKLGTHYHRLAKDIVAARPEVSPERLQSVDLELAPVFREIEVFRKTAAWWLITLTLLVILLLSLAVGSVISAAIFGRAPMLHFFGLAVVDRGGEPASRARLLARSALVWGALMAAFSVKLVLSPTSGAVGVLLAISTLGFLIGVPWTILRPTAGPHDRLAGTRVVPR